MPGVFAIVGETDREAEEKFNALQDLIDPPSACRSSAASWAISI